MATSTQTANGAAGGTRSGLTVGPLGPGEHAEAAFRFGASFLQTPQWAAVKPDWTAESLGWRTADGDLVGSALVLHRRLPGSGGRTLAYLPEGPSLPWTDVASAWTGSTRCSPTCAAPRLRRPDGPPPLGGGPALPRGLADLATSRLADSPPTSRMPPAPRSSPPCAPPAGPNWAAGRAYRRQPDHVVQIPAGCTVDDLRAGMNQEWRRNCAGPPRPASSSVAVTRPT